MSTLRSGDMRLNCADGSYLDYKSATDTLTIAGRIVTDGVATNGIQIDPAVLAMVQPGAKLRHWRGTAGDHPTSEVWHVRAVVDGEQVVCRVWRPGRGWVYFSETLLALHLAYEGGALEVAK